MPKSGLRQNFELQTRDRYTKVDCEVLLTVDGRELPNLTVLGTALEKAIEVIRDAVLESYKVVPERDAFATDQKPVQPVTPTVSATTDTGEGLTKPVTPATPANPFR
jgi:hypothetical protein